MQKENAIKIYGLIVELLDGKILQIPRELFQFKQGIWDCLDGNFERIEADMKRLDEGMKKRRNWGKKYQASYKWKLGMDAFYQQVCETLDFFYTISKTFWESKYGKIAKQHSQSKRGVRFVID